MMRPGATGFDTAIRSWIVAHQTPIGIDSAAIISRVGSVGVMRWIAVLVAILLLTRARHRAALAAALAPLLAFILHGITQRLIPRDRPPGAAGFHEAATSFPSHHATASTAVCLTLAYLLWRERLIAAPVAMAIAIAPPLCIGLSRLYLDVHWTTDVLAGWCAGFVVFAMAASFYHFRCAAGGS